MADPAEIARCPHCDRLLHLHESGFRWCSTDIRDPQTGEMLGCGFVEEPPIRAQLKGEV